MWLMEYLDDIESDFSAIHHLSPADTEDMPAARWVAWAERLPAYEGATRAAIAAEMRRQEERAQEAVDVMNHEDFAAKPELGLPPVFNVRVAPGE
jgi:hypothetical protein